MNNTFDNSLNNSAGNLSTKQKIQLSAANLFAMKGYTETSLRELADAVGLKAGSLYNHFPSKSAILDSILEDYAAVNNSYGHYDPAKLAKLKDNPTTDGILDCMKLTFPAGAEDYYRKVLCVILQEQHRNRDVGAFVSKHMILSSEQTVKSIIEILQGLNIIRQDIDPDFWMKIISSVIYTFASRMTLGIGDLSPHFTGLDMNGMLRCIFEIMLNLYGTADQQNPEPEKF